MGCICLPNDGLTLIFQFPFLFGTNLRVANISGNETRPLVNQIYRELEDEGLRFQYHLFRLAADGRSFILQIANVC